MLHIKVQKRREYSDGALTLRVREGYLHKIIQLPPLSNLSLPRSMALIQTALILKSYIHKTFLNFYREGGNVTAFPVQVFT